MYSLRRPSPTSLALLREQQAGRELTYDRVGMSWGDAPQQYPTSSVSAPAGQGNVGMLLARRAIRDWAGHAEAGVVLEPEYPVIEEGSVLALGARVFGVWVTAACRIVRVVDTDDQFGFAYGTLPHHPEVGEERFVARRDRDGTVHIEVEVCSMPATRLARIGGPLFIALRDCVVRRYLVGLVAAASPSGP